MYQTQFKKWGLQKNMKKEEKEDILRRKEEGEEVQDSKLDRKLRRHDPSKWKEIKVEQKQRNRNFLSRSILDESSGSESSSASSKLNNSLDRSQNLWLPQTGAGNSFQLQGVNYPNDPCGTNDVEQFLGEAISQSSSTNRTRRTLLDSLSPERPLQISQGDNHPRLLFECTSTLVISQLPKMTLQEGQISHPAMAMSSFERRFLHNVDCCLYLFKLQDLRRADPLLDQICQVSGEVIAKPSPAFVRKLIASLSPVNSRRNPTVRKRVLGYLSLLASRQLGPEHSFTIICQQLQHDVDSRYLTQRLLEMIRDLLEVRSPLVAMETNRSIIALLRRDKACDAAATMAIQQLHSCEQTFERGVVAIRDAQTELAHIYMDTKNWDQAIHLSLSRVGLAVAPDGLIGHEYHDRRAVWAMEDLAKIHEEKGERDRCSTWLTQAAALSAELCGRSIDTTHIVDKLEKSLCQQGRHGEAQIWLGKFEKFMFTKEMDVTKE